MMKWLIPLGIISILFIFNQTIDPLIASILKEEDLDDFIPVNSEEFLYKRIRKAKIVLLLLMLWGMMEYSVFYLVLVLVLFFFFLKKDYYAIKKEQKKAANLMKFQFPIWLRQLQILLQTNTVSQSLRLSYEHAPELIQKDLLILIEGIEKDAVNIAPYLNFLKNFRLSEIERTMKYLYRYNTVGKEDAFFQFNRMIQTTTKWLRSERESHHKDVLLIYEWISMVPLLGVTILFIAIMCEVVMNMFLNGM